MEGRLDRHALRDDQWRLIQPLLPTRPHTGRPAKDPRLMLDGILWILATGAPWRDLPERFGPWKTVYERFRAWTRAGAFDDVLAALEASRHAHGRIDWQLFAIDSTVVRAHKAAAGAKKKPAARRARRSRARAEPRRLHVQGPYHL